MTRNTRESDAFFVYLVMLDDKIGTSFVTGDPRRADEARELLAREFGNHRVSITRMSETVMAEYRSAVEAWKREDDVGPEHR
jgi:hypothetical protein